MNPPDSRLLIDVFYYIAVFIALMCCFTFAMLALLIFDPQKQVEKIVTFVYTRRAKAMLPYILEAYEIKAHYSDVWFHEGSTKKRWHVMFKTRRWPTTIKMVRRCLQAYGGRCPTAGIQLDSDDSFVFTVYY